MNLDQRKTYEKLDSAGVGESIASLGLQAQSILDLRPSFKLPKNYKNIKNIVLAGMGGSNLAGYIFSSLFHDDLKVPFIISADYSLPEFVDKNTLVLASSYSGSTEEVLTAYREARKRKAKIVVIAEDKKGKLQAFARRDKIPALFFKAEHNPCGQPRLGTGYSLMAILSVLKSANLLKIKNTDLGKALLWMEKINKKNMPNVQIKNNPAKKYAQELLDRAPILVGAEFLKGNLHTLRNQLNETSKLYSSYLFLPDLNHHAMEGLLHPSKNNSYLAFLFFSSDLYNAKISKRLELTKELVRKNKIKVLDYKLKGVNKIEQSFELLQFGAWLTYYLAMLYDLDPVEIPFVEWFKEQIK